MATLGKEIVIAGENKIGALSNVTAPIKKWGISIRAVCAWGDGGKASFLLVTDNNDKAAEVLKKAGYGVQQNEVVLAELPHKVGALAGAGVDITHCYVSASGDQALAVFATKDNQKALKALG